MQRIPFLSPQEETCRDLCWPKVIERTVRSDLVIVNSPFLDDLLGFARIVEPMFVQAVIPELTVMSIHQPYEQEAPTHRSTTTHPSRMAPKRGDGGGSAVVFRANHPSCPAQYPQDNTYCKEAVSRYADCLSSADSFLPWTLEDVVSALKQEPDAVWIDLFYERYLDFQQLMDAADCDT